MLSLPRITSRRPHGWARAPGFVLALAVALFAAAGQPAVAQQSLPGGFSAEQIEGLEQIIQQYLLENPDVLVEALNTYQQRQRLAEEDRKQQALVENLAELRTDPNTPVVGNPDGDVVIVEFFDYRCGYCRRVVQDLRALVEEDGNIRLAMKEFPILGPASTRAARAALAADKQGQYEAYHFALMTQPGDMSDPHLMQVARQFGMDVEQLKADMDSEEISALIQRNHALAQSLGIGGTPAFVFGDTLVPGAIDADTMRRLVAEARAKAS